MTVVFMLLLGMSGLFVGLPVWMWWHARRDALELWSPRPVSVEHVGEGSYRDANLQRLEARGAPRVVQVTAVMCFVLGTMFVPGLLGGLYGLIAMGLGLVSIPGLMLAWRLFFLGGPLMRAEAGSAEKARSAALFARVLNVIVMSLCIMVALFSIPSVIRERPYQGGGAVWLGMAVAVALYATISLIHAKLLDVSADHVDAEWARRMGDATGVRVEAAPEPRADVEHPLQQFESPRWNDEQQHRG